MLKQIPFQIGDIVELKIQKLSFNGGRGVARHDGFVVFVPKVLPDELIKARITNLKKSYAEAELITVLQSSPYRREPPCIYFKNCSGCSWQHIEDSYQLELKVKLFMEFLNEFPLQKPIEIVSSPHSLHYRNRIQIHKIGSKLGYHKRNSTELVAIEKCLIADDKINNFFSQVRLQPDGRYEIYLDIENQIGLRRQDSKQEAMLFSQINQKVNHIMKKTTIDWLSIAQPKSLLELYSGAGNFTFEISNHFPDLQIMAFEGSKKLVQIAQRESNPNIHFECTDLNFGINTKKLLVNNFDIILLDPPRDGASAKLIKDLAKLNAKNIFYISCSPPSLKRDLQLLKTVGYTPVQTVIFDMFPQTDHIESLTWITKSLPLSI